MKRFLSAFALAVTLVACAAEVIPPPPKAYFNDYAAVVSPAINARLNQQLEDFERTTSNQILVAIFAKMQSDSSIEDYTVRIARSWKVGQKDRNNGAVLFVFTQDRKMFLQVGYGLEGVLPDALCKRIIEDEIKPRFRNNDFDSGLAAGVNAILAATKGEYRGTGRTRAEALGRGIRGSPPVIALLIVLAVGLLILLAVRKAARGGYYSRRGWTSGGWTGGGWSSGGWSGGGWSGGGGGSSSSGGFSGGGGDFGGGGAGGSW